jgi:hypothetical protein
VRNEEHIIVLSFQHLHRHPLCYASVNANLFCTLPGSPLSYSSLDLKKERPAVAATMKADLAIARFEVVVDVAAVDADGGSAAAVNDLRIVDLSHVRH